MKYISSFFLLIYFLYEVSLANETERKLDTKCYSQWFAGPLFAPNPTTVDPKHPGIEPAIIFSNYYGRYNNSGDLYFTPYILSITPYIDFQVGITKKIAFEIIALAVSNFSKGASSTHFKDTIFRLGYQISNDISYSWVPDFRIVFQETFPTGKFQKLNFQKNGTDSTGQGSYQTGVHFVTQKLFYANTQHPFRIRGDFGYFFPSSVEVSGINYYGGDAATSGIVYPGQHYTAFLFWEYSISRTWALACELNYLAGKKGRFASKAANTFKVPSFNQFIVYPEIQHTLSNNSALIFGGTYTVFGKNSAAFWSLLLAFLHVF